MGELHRRPLGLVPSAVRQGIEKAEEVRTQPSLKREPRERKGNKSLISHHLSLAADTAEIATCMSGCTATHENADRLHWPHAWTLHHLLTKMVRCRRFFQIILCCLAQIHQLFLQVNLNSFRKHCPTVSSIVLHFVCSKNP